VARHCDVSVRAVFKWAVAFSERGQNALLARKGAGRPTKFRPDLLGWIADSARDRTPDQLTFEFGSWALRLTGSLIERQFQMTLGKVMRQLGFTAQHALYRGYQQVAALVAQRRAPKSTRRCLDARRLVGHWSCLPTSRGCARTTTRQGLVALRSVAGGTRHWPACLRPHAVGGWHWRETEVHAARGAGLRRGIPHVP